MLICPYKSTDVEAVVNLFYQTIHTINTRDYTSEQVDAWAPVGCLAESERSKWDQRFTQSTTLVVEYDGVVVGYSNFTQDEKLDHFFVHKDFQGQGIGTMLIKAIEASALSLGLKKLTADVSITAKLFFEKHGYVVEKAQTIERRGQRLNNFVMSKNLTV